MSNQIPHGSELIRCPKCGVDQKPGDMCQRCGLIFAKYRSPEQTNLIHVAPITTAHEEPGFGVRPAYILLSLVAILIAILAYKLPVQEIYADLLQNKHWTYDFSMFHAGRAQDELTAELKRDGYEVKCREYPGVTKDDVFICQVFITKVWGMQSSEVDIFFDQGKALTSLLFTFPADQYSAVSQKLDQYGQKSNEDYGVDPDGGQVEAWITEGGIAISSSAPAPTGIKVYWVRHNLENNNEGQSVRK